MIQPPPSPVSAGLRSRCGTCGEGRLYARYLTFKPACDVCGQDFSKADTADGPAFFVGFGALILFAPIYFLLPVMGLPIWAVVIAYLVLAVAMVGVILALLPPAKAILLNLQLRHKAEEARFED